MRSVAPRPGSVEATRAARTVRHRRLGTRILAVALAFSALLTVSAWAAQSSPASVNEAAERLGPSHDGVRALIISDSTWLSMRTFGAFDAVQGFPNELVLAQCRRRVDTSCSTPTGTPPTLVDELKARGGGGRWNTLIVQTGYNDSDVTFERDFRLIVDTARQLDYTQIVWLTLRIPEVNPVLADKYRNANAYLADLVASGKFPDVVIADWASYSAEEVTWVGSDGIHYTKTGAWAAADYISRKVAAINGWPCENPMQAGANRDWICPDPDASTTKPDLESLYPMSVSYFQPTYSWTGSSSWPNPPWWE